MLSPSPHKTEASVKIKSCFKIDVEKSPGNDKIYIACD